MKDKGYYIALYFPKVKEYKTEYGSTTDGIREAWHIKVKSKAEEADVLRYNKLFAPKPGYEVMKAVRVKDEDVNDRRW